MAVRGEEEVNFPPDLNATIALTTIFTVSGLALAGAQLHATLTRPPRSARVTSALLWPTIFFFIAGSATTLAVPAYARTHGPWIKDGFYWTDFNPPDALFRLIVFFPGLGNLLAIIAMRTLFYEVTSGKAFVTHRAARKVFLGFDITILIMALGMLLGTTGAGRPCCFEGGTTPGQLLMTSVFDYIASLGFQYFLFAEYVVTWVASALACKWTTRHGLNVSIAKRMQNTLTPLLALESILLIIMTVVHFDGDITGSDFLDFYVSIPWRIGQVALISVLVWLSALPLGEDSDGTQTALHTQTDAEAGKQVDDPERLKE